MSRFAATAILGLATTATGFAMLASNPVFAEPYPRETVECRKGLVYDQRKKRCVPARSGVTPDTVLTGNAFRRAATVAKS